MSTIYLATTAEQIRACYPTMQQLRPHLSESSFVNQVQQQFAEGYQLLALAQADHVLAVAGFRLQTSLSAGKHVYVDDLVTDENTRSQGLGEAVFNWLVDYAKANDCTSLHLDSGVQRHAAHRFYLRQRMDIVHHHFALPLID